MKKITKHKNEYKTNFILDLSLKISKIIKGVSKIKEYLNLNL